MQSPLSDSDRGTLKQLFDQMVRFRSRYALGEVVHAELYAAQATPLSAFSDPGLQKLGRDVSALHPGARFPGQSSVSEFAWNRGQP